MWTQSSHKVGSGIKRVLQGAADVTLNVVDRAGGATLHRLLLRFGACVRVCACGIWHQ
jgi:hypothetical protein